ncbi:MAG: hypothetical protein GY774_17490 [Planctomycetes bacterium]|nr:hypothetical protein [Planctomycetota bacterium]
MIEMGSNDLVACVDKEPEALARELIDECIEVATICGIRRVCFYSVIERFSTQAFPRRTAYFWGRQVSTLRAAEDWFFNRMTRFNNMIRDCVAEEENMDFQVHRGLTNVRQYLKDDLHFNARGLFKHWKSLRRCCIIQAKKARPWPKRL